MQIAPVVGELAELLGIIEQSQQTASDLAERRMMAGGQEQKMPLRLVRPRQR